MDSVKDLSINADKLHAKGECYLCNGSVHLHRLSAGYHVVRCVRCGLIYVSDKITDDTLAKFYDSEYFRSSGKFGYDDYLADEQNHRRNARTLLSMIPPDIRSAGLKVCDVGCAYGFLMDEAQKKGCLVQGVELSQSGYEYATMHLKLDVRNGLLADDTFAAGSFDVVFLIGTLEHLADPRQVVRIIRRILKPGGLLILTTVDTRSRFPLYMIKPPEHLFYFSHENIPLLFDGQSFAEVRVRPYYASYRVSDVLYRLGVFFKSRFFDKISRVAEKMFSQWRLRIPTNEMVVIARASGGMEKD